MVQFFRVISGFMIQGGDPNGNGRSDDGISTILDELSPSNQNYRGTIAMANAGPNTGTSQFFINVVNNNYLDALHPVFGQIIEGMDIVDAISNVATNTNDRPLEEVVLLDAKIIQNGHIPIINNILKNPLPNNVNYTDNVRVERAI
jgi:peptidylprolyl isomerase